MAIRIVDIEGADTFALVPPCADTAFDHRSCDYWEDADRGSKARRAAGSAASPTSSGAPVSSAAPKPSPIENPFAPAPREAAFNPFLASDDDAEDNPFLPRKEPIRPALAPDAPRKLGLLSRGIGVFGMPAMIVAASSSSENVRRNTPRLKSMLAIRLPSGPWHAAQRPP